MNSSKILCLLICSISWTFANAQVQTPTIEKSTEKVRIGSEVYYIHTIKKGETIYSLSKVYEVSVEQIQQDNPEVNDGLKEGSTIKIPATPPSSTVKKGKEKPKEIPVQKIEPKENPSDSFVYHLVKPKETLWSISRQYGVSSDELRKLNPNAFKNDELMNGALIQIPAQLSETKIADAPTSDSTKVAVAINPQYHLVKQGETLYSLAQLYATTPDELRALNPEAFKNDELMNGVLLQLPLKASETDIASNSDSIKPTSYEYFDIPTYANMGEPTPLTRPIKASLILPLLAPEEIIGYLADSITPITAKSRKADNFFDFYKGALLAVEDLKSQGLSLQLSVYDSYDSKKINAILASNVLNDEDIIFGPVYASDIQSVAQFANENHIEMISPLDPNAEIFANENPYFFQISPPVYYRQKKLIDDILVLQNTNTVLVYSSDGSDSTLVAAYQNLLGENFAQVKLMPYHVQKVSHAREELLKLMNAEKNNCVLIASNNEALVADIAANLYLLTSLKSFSIKLYGNERWRNFETIDLRYFHALNLHLVIPFFIDYQKEDVKNFVERFQNIYKSDPSQYAFQGYDMFYYFLQAMMLYGNDFQKYLPHHNPTLLQTNYQFKHRGNTNSGLVNTESCLIIYNSNFTITRKK